MRLWIRGKTVCSVVCGRRRFDVLRPHPTPFAGNVFEVRQLLLSQHRRLNMISDALELRVEGGRVSNN